MTISLSSCLFFRLLRSLQDTARIIEDSSYFLLHKVKSEFTAKEDALQMVKYVSVAQSRLTYFEKLKLSFEKQEIVVCKQRHVVYNMFCFYFNCGEVINHGKIKLLF